MYATYQFLSSIRDPKLMNKTTEDVVIEFQEYKSQNRDVSRHIGEVFCKNFGVCNKVYQVYSTTVPEDDASSIVLELLNDVMSTWQKNAGVQFITYFHRCLNLKFKWMCEYWYAYKGRSAKNASIEQMMEDRGDSCFGYSDGSYESANVIASLPTSLTDEEQRVVKVILNAPKIYQPDVVAITGFAPHRVESIYASLKRKLAGVI